MAEEIENNVSVPFKKLNVRDALSYNKIITLLWQKYSWTTNVKFYILSVVVLRLWGFSVK